MHEPSNSTPPPDARAAAGGISRRGWFRRVAVALLAVPALRLGETVARAERRRRNHRGQAEDIWIGHC